MDGGKVKKRSFGQLFQLLRVLVNPNQNPAFAEKLFFALAIVLLLPALLINLGKHNLSVHTDEPRRALVSLEMILSGNYLTPTLKGEIYLNKPPLYNWIIVAFFKLFNEYSEFALRLPAVISVFIFLFAIYRSVKPHTSFRVAAFSALAFVTSYRILFYDSFLGLIDITYSLATYVSFILIYKYGTEKKYLKLFLISYALTAAGFLMKGLPSLLFQAFTLLVFFISRRRFKYLFYPAHFAGIGVLIGILGVYYYSYLTANAIELSQIWRVLLFESTTRTVVRFGMLNTFLYLFKFPFDQIIANFFPWSILVIFLFSKKSLALIRENEFIKFNLLVFLANIWVYWTSPETRARYLFMMIPLLFTVIIFLADQLREHMKKRHVVVSVVFILTGALMAALELAGPFIERGRNAPQMIDAWVFVFFALIIYFLALFFRSNMKNLTLFALFLISVRIAYSYYFLPQRAYSHEFMKQEAIHAGRLLRGHDAKFLGWRTPHDSSAFYMTREYGRIIHKTFGPPNGETFYIVSDEWPINDKKAESIYKFEAQNHAYFYIVHFNMKKRAPVDNVVKDANQQN